MKTVSSPLFIEDKPGNSNEVARGFVAKRQIIVKNTGDTRADVDIWISATDNKSDSLLSWCKFSEKNPLSIEAKRSQEVTLNFQIPPQAPPDLYNYEIIVEAAAQYPGKVSRRPQQLRVLPSQQDAEWVNEPGFSIQPISNSTNPLALQAGEQLVVNVKVENHSKRVDRFYINCPELSNEWYTVQYPEDNLNFPGIVRESDGLELNPDSTGEIILIFHPPRYTLAGYYFPTINLISTNRGEDAALLDVVYLQILADDKLSVQMRSLSRKIPQEAGEFELELINQGNIEREIGVRAKDKDELFSYVLTPAIAQLEPGEAQIVTLKAKSQKWWRRHWRSQGLTFNVEVELENASTEPSKSPAPALPSILPQPTIVWQPHPWWRYWLLILLGLGSIGGIGFAVWLNYLNNQIPSPKVVDFVTKAKKYQEGKDKNIDINWQISHPSQVKKVTLIRLQGNVETDRISYSLPEKLSNNFGLGNGNCQVVKKLSSEVEKEKQENKSWLSSILHHFSKSNSEKTIDFLTCKTRIPNNQKAGSFNFKIEVFPKNNPEQPSSSQLTDTIAVQPRNLPKIVNFNSTYHNYQEANKLFLQPTTTRASNTLNPSLKSTQTSSQLVIWLPTKPELLDRAELQRTQRRNNSNTNKLGAIAKSIPTQNGVTPAPILLNWEISHLEEVKELRIIGRAPDGSVNSVEKRYVLTHNNLSPDLKKFCQPQEALGQKHNLVCKNVPMNDAREAGNYIFTLTVIPKEGEEVSKKTDTIKVQPKPVKPATPINIVSFKVDSQEVNQNPKRIFRLNELAPNASIHLTWQVEDGEDIKVELGAFGEVEKQGSRNYAISQSPIREIVELKVTNKAGETKTQQVVIETVGEKQQS
ncbi:hypothetical protein WA1_19830 [Scytonema hofmannii PCC 7110]|uniref:Uncharacterized protein n=1 Tax=Scytonema hofmannii PCC 7110 TaxID=128403 RepID=A0A139XC83_9CYAN|nr:hypothetical protein [Scytonema hofmannii]KYC42232.1 hypothetical protein WA1_19830 [Scytonema hofmannii PCC 7110]